MPQFFDALLLIWTALAAPARLRAMEALEAAALQIDGVSLKVHRFGGNGFTIAGREFAHVHGNGLLDVHTGRAAARELIAAGAAGPHHVFGHSAWVSFWIHTPGDLPAALALLRTAAARRSQ